MKKTLVVLCILILALGSGLLAAGKTDDQVAKKAKKAYEKGMDLLKGNQLDKALEQFTQAIQLEPEWAKGYSGRALLEYRQKSNDASLTDIEKARSLDANLLGDKEIALAYAQILSNKGFAAYNAGQFDNSNSFLTKVLEVPQLAVYNKKFYLDILFLVGYNFFQVGQGEKAVSYFSTLKEMATDKDPQFAELYAKSELMSGLALSRMKKYDEGNAALLRFLDLAKSVASVSSLAGRANYMLGINSYDQLNQTVEALKAEKMGAERQKKIDELAAQKAKLEKSKSSASVQKAQKLAIDIIAVENEESMEKKDKIAKLALQSPVESYLTPALSMPEVQEDVLLHLGNYSYLCKNYTKATENYKQLVEKFPTSPDIGSYKSFLQTIEKEVAEAAKEVKK